MNFTRISVIIISLFSLQFFVGCTKTADSPFSPEYINMVKDNAVMQAAFDDVLKVAENIMMNNGDARVSTVGAPLDCYTSVDTVIMGVNLKRYTVNFHQGCSSYDGKIRRGTMIFDLEGTNYNTAGAKLTVTFDDYSFDSNTLWGKMIVTNQGSGIFKMVITGSNGSGYARLNLYSEVKNIRWRAILKRKITFGDADNIIINNKYHISTPANGPYYIEGLTSDYKAYSANIPTYLILDNSCNAVGVLRYPTAGTIDFTSERINFRSVDYGLTSDCDKKVAISANGTSASYDLY
jgi:hypothetical protein